jgi:multidrug efflux pump subunit AcrB
MKKIETLQERVEENSHENELNSKEEIIKEAEEFQDSPWVFLVRKSKLTILIIIALLVFGVATISTIPRELNPEVKIPIIAIATAFPGASPLDVEQQITKKIETEISDAEGVKRVDSTSSLGFSSIVVEFEAGEDIDKAVSDLKDRVDIAKTELPEDATEPRVVEISIDDQPIMEVTLVSKEQDISDLKRFAENLENEISGVAFVSEVNISGGKDRVVKVDFDQDLLAQKGLSAQGVMGTLNANNVNFPIGSVAIEESRYNVRVEGEFEKSSEIAVMPVGNNVDGSLIYLEDVANVYDDFSKEFSRSRFSITGEQPLEAVSMQIYKKTGGDVTALAEEVRNLIEEEKGSSYPENVTVEVTNDFSVFVTDSIDTLVSNGVATVILILLLLLIFLGWQEALLAGLAVPFSFFIAFIVMASVGVSLNTISLFALVLSLGLLVDSAIVIVEGIHNKVEKYRLTGYQASISTIKEYAAPLFAGMLTTVAAFFPLLFVQGIFGSYIKTIPIVVISTLIAGLFVSISIIPAIGMYLIKPIKSLKRTDGNSPDQNKERSRSFFARLKDFFTPKPRRERVSAKIFDWVAEHYREKIPMILKSRKRRIQLIAGSWIMFFVSLALPIFGLIDLEAFGQEDSDFFYINLELPNGIVLDRTDEVVTRIEDELAKEPAIKSFVTNVGSSIGSNGETSGSEGASNSGFIQVNLVDRENREVDSFEFVSDLRKKLESVVTEGEIRFVELASGPPAGQPIELRVSGPDLLVLEELADEIAGKLRQIPTTIDVETSVELAMGELVFTPNKEILQTKGISVIQIATELRSKVARNNDIEITRDGEEIKIDAGINEEQLLNVEDVKDLSILSSKGEKFAITELGTLTFEPSLATINRRDSERVVLITGNTDGGNVNEISSQLGTEIEKMSLPADYSTTFGGEAQEMTEVYMDMFLKMILGIILILFILVLQFNSYKQTLIIIGTIPLAMIGVLWGMTIFNMTLDIPAFIGIISLAGIVVNNAIILIDQINRELAAGRGLIDASRNAGFIRLRPIFLTTITTVFGLLPLSISQPIWRNLGFSIIFGLLFSTLLTLVIVPTMFVSLYRKQFPIEEE